MTQRLTNHFSTNARVVSTMSIYLYSYPFKLIRVCHFPKFILFFDDDDDDEITGNILEVFKLNVYIKYIWLLHVLQISEFRLLKNHI